MDSTIALPRGCRVVRAWGVGGGAWNVAAAIVLPIMTVAGILSVFVLISAGSAALGMWRGGEAFELGSFLEGLLSFLASVLLIVVSLWVFRRRKVFRQLRAEAKGEEAAYARACVAEPEAPWTLDREKMGGWMAEFRRASQDVLLMDEVSALILWDARDDRAPAEIVLRGIPRTVAIPFVILLMIGIGVGVWINSDSWIERILGLTMDVGATAWSAYAILGRERRLGGDRVARPGQFVHGAASWSPPEAVLKIRRFSMGFFAWFTVWTIGPGGYTYMRIVDRPASRRSLRELIRLWIRPLALAGESGTSAERS
jgi:hypothetical protein